MSGPNAEETPSDIVARRIVMMRKRRNLTREQLAARCAELGYPDLTGPALANIETGRRNKDGRRRRDVTVEELMALAKALAVAPVLLVFPVGQEPTVEPVPGWAVPTWEAVQWFTGDGYPAEDVTDYWAVPLFLFREHAHQIGELVEAMADGLFAPDERKAEFPEIRARAEQGVRGVRAEMRRHGLTPPELEPDLEYLDEKRHVYLTPDQMEDIVARHPGALRFVDGARPGGGAVVKPGTADNIRKSQELAAGWRDENGEGAAQ